jgi:Ca2+:H+ antiporter
MNDEAPLEELRPVVDAARREAVRLGHDFIGSEHLLLALLRSEDAGARAAFASANLDPSVVAARLEGSVRPGRTTDPAAERGLRSGARKVLEQAEAEARSAGVNGPRAEHLLAVLKRERRGPVAQALGAGSQEPRQDHPARPESPPKGGRRRERETEGREKGRERDREPKARTPASSPAAPAIPESAPRSRRVAPPARRPILTLRNLLLLAVPGSWVAYQLHAAPVVVFLAACVGVLPLAGYMGEATEHLSHRTGPTFGGFLNATFGNAAELIIALVALNAGLVDLVKASITGSILGNLLLILGLSLLAGGRQRTVLKFNRSAAAMSSAMLALAVVGLVLPALFHVVHPEAAARVAELHMSELVAAILGLTYLASLLFSLRTHRDLFRSEGHPVEGPPWSRSFAMLVLGVATAGIAVQSEILVHATQQVTETVGLSQTFLGLVVIPLIGNAAEHATAVVVARKGQIDLALQIALGSSTQVALLIAPVLVFAGVAMGQAMDLVFHPFEVVALWLATIVVAFQTLDGESNWFEGVQLVAVYGMFAAVAYFI